MVVSTIHMWFPLFTWLVDVSVQNAWLLGREANCRDCDSLLTFRRTIATFHLTHYGREPKHSGRRCSNAPASVSFDLIALTTMLYAIKAMLGVDVPIVAAGVYVAKNAIQIFALSASSTITLSDELIWNC